MGQNKVYISSTKNDGNVISLLSFSFNQTIIFTAAPCKKRSSFSNYINNCFFPITQNDGFFSQEMKDAQLFYSSCCYKRLQEPQVNRLPMRNN